MPDRYRHMVALGSSFAAGPGVQPTIDAAAMRSGNNYAHLVASTLGAELTDASVSGATTSTILHTPQKTPRRTFAPQIESVTGTTDLVTVTAGGNDLGYLGGVLGTGLLNHYATSRLVGPVARRMRRTRSLVLPDAGRVQGATNGLIEISREVRRRSPGATVVLVGYLPLFDGSDDAVTGAGFSTDQVEHFRRVGELLSQAYTEASRQTGAGLVATSDFSAGHGVGSADPWLFDRQPLRNLGASYHPNEAGMRAVAAALLHHLDDTSGDAQ